VEPRNPCAPGRYCASGIDQRQAAAACVPEELPRRRQSPGTVVGLLSQKRLDIGDLCQCPMVLAAFRLEELRQVPHRRERRFDGAVAARLGAGAPERGIPTCSQAEFACEASYASSSMMRTAASSAAGAAPSIPTSSATGSASNVRKFGHTLGFIGAFSPPAAGRSLMHRGCSDDGPSSRRTTLAPSPPTGRVAAGDSAVSCSGIRWSTPDHRQKCNHDHCDAFGVRRGRPRVDVHERLDAEWCQRP
jgi:hypothetical protein